MIDRIADLRQEYAKDGLLEGHVGDTPIELFAAWFEDALEGGVVEPNAMTLATVDAAGRPSARIVLLKGFDDNGFVFYTNRSSRKGSEMAANTYASLVFWWEPLQRQVRIDGDVEWVADDESDAYFASRPRGSQLGAWASEQSAVIESREVLSEKLKALEAHYEGREVPRPPHWGGYRVIPRSIEFWQGRPSRLHDRLIFRRDSDSWNIARLSP